MPEIDPPWRLDPLQTIVDVHWNVIVLGLTWLGTRTFEQETVDGNFCTPATNEAPPGAQLIQSYVTGIDFELIGPYGMPEGGVLQGGPPTVFGDVATECSGPFVKSGEFQETLHNFDILGRPVTVAEGCYGQKAAAFQRLDILCPARMCRLLVR